MRTGSSNTHWIGFLVYLHSMCKPTAVQMGSTLTREGKVGATNARYHLASISSRFRFKLFVLIYRSLHKVCSPLLTDCVVTRVNATHTASITRSQVTLSLALPPANNRYGLYALSFLGADRWNSLPASVRTCSTLSDFRSSIQKHIGYPVRRP